MLLGLHHLVPLVHIHYFEKNAFQFLIYYDLILSLYGVLKLKLLLHLLECLFKWDLRDNRQKVLFGPSEVWLEEIHFQMGDLQEQLRGNSSSVLEENPLPPNQVQLRCHFIHNQLPPHPMPGVVRPRVRCPPLIVYYNVFLLHGINPKAKKQALDTVVIHHQHHQRLILNAALFH